VHLQANHMHQAVLLHPGCSNYLLEASTQAAGAAAPSPC
jgi:hypothetical protein